MLIQFTVYDIFAVFYEYTGVKQSECVGRWHHFDHFKAGFPTDHL